MAVDTNVIRDEELLDKLVTARERILSEIRKTIIGQDEVVEQVLISLFVGGHSIITGVPGLAKTLLVRTIANVLDLSFKRIQFTPDLMPPILRERKLLKKTAAQAGERCSSFADPSLPTLFSRMRSIGLRRRRNQRSLKQCRRVASLFRGRHIHCLGRSLFLRRRTRLRWKARIHCRKRNWTASCSMSESDTCRKKKKSL